MIIILQHMEECDIIALRMFRQEIWKIVIEEYKNIAYEELYFGMKRSNNYYLHISVSSIYSIISETLQCSKEHS